MSENIPTCDNEQRRLSIIIPRYNEETRIGESLEKIVEYMRAQPYAWEVLTVDDGSQDRTREIVKKFIARHSFDRILLYGAEHRGKGHALRVGVLNACGALILLTDADLSTPIEEAEAFLPLAENNYDIVIGSREAKGSHRYEEPFLRHVVGRVFNYLVRSLTVKGFNDTQCGFKVFRREVARVLFRRLTIEGFSFDVEILYLAQKLGLRIGELPVPWYYSPSSTVRVPRDGFQMGLDVLRIKWNDLMGRYR